MSRTRTSAPARRSQLRRHAPIFAALGDETRLTLLGRLTKHSPSSISELASGSPITRQAITKHLGVLESAGLVRAATVGRERLFELDPKPLSDAQSYLELVCQQWDEALSRLKNFVE